MFLTKMRKYPFSIVCNHLITYPTPINLSYMWSFGSLAGIYLTIQIITGFLLSLHYIPSIDLAFSSVEQHIMRDVNGGWFIRYAHSNGASMFFIMLYIHISKGLYFSSYKKPNQNLWISGVIIFLIAMATAFLGYVLPWGQMSYWGATVITNLFTAIPLIGNAIAVWIWGGFSVGQGTLSRFYSLHFLLPFVMLGMVLIHIMFLHQVGSTNPLGIDSIDFVWFGQYFIIKDLFAFFCSCFLYFYLIFFAPNYLGHPDNYIEANPLVTPAHIVPEWYFLPFYAILRAIPNKGLGVAAMFCAIAIFFLLPYLPEVTYVRTSNVYYGGSQISFFLFCAIFIGLGILGGKPVEPVYVIRAQILTALYFLYFLTISPLEYYYANNSKQYIQKTFFESK